MSKYKCVIFDCDGVLVDSEPIGNQVLVDMSNNLGASIDLDYAYKHFKGGSLKNCVQKIAELVEKELPVDFENEYRRLSYAAFEKHIKPIDGILDLVESLSMPFCVASSGPEHKIRLNLQLTGLMPFFENKIFSCYTIQKWKPDPAVFIWAAKTMGFNPKDCLVIEDSITGVKAAKSGGFTVVGYTAHDYNDELSEVSDYVFKSMENVKELLST
nr:HAD family hydrolase [uncultured Psychroserpens sp.]